MLYFSHFCIFAICNTCSHEKLSWQCWKCSLRCQYVVSGSKEQLGFQSAWCCQFSSPEHPQPPPSSLPAAGPQFAPCRPCWWAPDVTLPTFLQHWCHPLVGAKPPKQRGPALQQQGGICPRDRNWRRGHQGPEPAVLPSGRSGEKPRPWRQGQQTGGERPDLLESHCLVEDYHRGPSLKSPFSLSLIWPRKRCPCYTCNLVVPSPLGT